VTGPSVNSFITRMRAQQSALFDSTVSLGRTSGAGAFDEATASYGAPTSTAGYTGPALVRPGSTVTSSTVSGGATSTEIAGYMVKLPPDTAVAVGDVITIVDSEHDAGLVGLTLRVLEVQPDEWQIARRVFAVDQQARPT
jgi:hypothetical protein